MSTHRAVGTQGARSTHGQDLAGSQHKLMVLARPCRDFGLVSCPTALAAARGGSHELHESQALPRYTHMFRNNFPHNGQRLCLQVC